MKIVCVADLHGHLPEIEPCDLLLIGGDVCPLGSEPGYGGSLGQQMDWLEGPFMRWLYGVPAANVVGIAGNHDFVAAERPFIMEELPWIYLLDGETTVNGLKIWGSPYANFLPGWVFMETDDKLAQRWEKIPDDTDILMVHGPAFLYRNVTLKGEHVGSISLAARIRELKQLKLFVFGHTHESYGVNPLVRGINPDAEDIFDWIPLVNASHVNYPGYEPVNPPIIFEI